MKLSQETYRKEIKYKVFIQDLPKLYHWLYSSSFFQQSYFPRVVNSLYFDTLNYDFASSNMSGESNRIKVRARWYAKSDEKFIDSFRSESQSFNFELKRKFNNISDKLSIGKISFKKEDEYINRINNIQKKLNSICKDHEILHKYTLCKAVFTNYDREYYELTSNQNIRLTVDKNISYCDCENPSMPLLISKDYVVVELKFNPKLSKKVIPIMNNFPFRQVRSSKFLSTIAQFKRVSY